MDYFLIDHVIYNICLRLHPQIASSARGIHFFFIDTENFTGYFFEEKIIFVCPSLGM
jgi:hypothetical protein